MRSGVACAVCASCASRAGSSSSAACHTHVARAVTVTVDSWVKLVGKIARMRSSSRRRLSCGMGSGVACTVGASCASRASRASQTSGASGATGHTHVAGGITVTVDSRVELIGKTARVGSSMGGWLSGGMGSRVACTSRASQACRASRAGSSSGTTCHTHIAGAVPVTVDAGISLVGWAVLARVA
jgi:hypothetical protein